MFTEVLWLSRLYWLGSFLPFEYWLDNFANYICIKVSHVQGINEINLNHSVSEFSHGWSTDLKLQIY